MRFPKSQSGVTLLEAMLALGIGSIMIILSLRMYEQFQLDASLNRLQYNVDSLFQAMSLYYKANCFATYDSDGNLSTFGTLNPRNPTPPNLTKPYVVTLADLQGVNTYLRDWHPDNPLVNPGAGTDQGYFMQFDPIMITAGATDAPTTVNACTDMATTPCTITATPVNPIAANQQPGHYMPPNQVRGLIWKLQVSVLLLDPTKANTYMNVLGANCNSDVVAGVVEPCEKPPAANNGYLVWERLPSVASPNSATVNGTWMHNLTQFNLQYTHDQMYELIPGSTDQSLNTLRYYLCGG